MHSKEVETPAHMHKMIARKKYLEDGNIGMIRGGLISMGASSIDTNEIIETLQNIENRACPSHVEKRDGRIQPFDESLIQKAATRALAETGEGTAGSGSLIGRTVIFSLKEDEVTKPCVEGIQDRVERAFIYFGFADTARAFIRYRDRASEKRSEIVDPVTRELTEANHEFFDSALSEFVFYRSYSRWIPSEKRRETWPEVVDRYLQYMRGKLGNKVDEMTYARIREFILDFRAMPSMRLMWSAGPAADATHATAYNCTYTTTTQWKHFGEIMYLSMCGAGVGFSVESHIVQKLPMIDFQKREENVEIYTIEDSKEGWCDALEYGMEQWSRGHDIKFDYSKLRPAGARLRTMGGRSAGPGPLRLLLDYTRRLFKKREGRRLRNIDVHDLICKIGEIVVCGGVRRTALISLSDLDDDTLRDAKCGAFRFQNPERERANNSAVYTTPHPGMDLLSEWLALAKSGTGERGIMNRYGMLDSMPSRRVVGFEPWKTTCGVNPCVTADTWVTTANGIYQVKDLIDQPFTAQVDGKCHAAPNGFFKTGFKSVCEVKTSRGFTLSATPDHKVRVAKGEYGEWEWVPVCNLQRGDKIMLHNHRANMHAYEGPGSYKQGWLVGSLFGNGNITKRGIANLDFWEPDRNFMSSTALKYLHSEFKVRSDLQGHVPRHGVFSVGSASLGEFAEQFGISNSGKDLTSRTEKTSASFSKGFLRGWFDTDGTVIGSLKKGVSVRLGSISLSSLHVAQRMLARFGIISTVHENRKNAGFKEMPDGEGETSEYWCQAFHELVISRDNVAVFQGLIGFSHPSKKAKLARIRKEYIRAPYRETFTTTVTEINSKRPEEVYDCHVEDVHAFDANGMVVHNCGEIVLRSQQMCNLTEIVARPNDSLATLQEKCEIATILGVYQSTLTDFKYLNASWKKNCEEERLLGVSITGYWDCPAVRNDETLQKLLTTARETAITWAERIGVNASVAITCTKPSGTISQLVNAAPGLHPRFAKYYIRRIRIAASDPLLALMKDQGFSVVPEVGQTEVSATTFVLSFPVKAPEGAAVTRDMPALEQLETWKRLKVHYTEHNPSATITVREDEWIKVLHWLTENWAVVGGLSFLPHSNHVYELAPFEEITEEEYEKAVAVLPSVDYSRLSLFEEDDETTGHQEPACESGLCAV